ADLQAEANTKVDQAQDLVDRLTAEQQRALLAAQAAAAAAASQNAADAAPDSAGQSSRVIATPPPVVNGAGAQAIVDWATARVGFPYVYGGAGPNSYDCSGFTMAAYATLGISLPHGSIAQFHYGVAVPLSDLQPGDLVFYYSGPSHVEIYVGGGMTIGARNARLGVVYRELNSGMPIAGARRLL
ncbi:MAG: C40 family peptidase, partial [Propionibacteriaceae bacterium]|nr:C40 family peptidase [Propionibacteriaceae bacterium]